MGYSWVKFKSPTSRLVEFRELDPAANSPPASPACRVLSPRPAVVLVGGWGAGGPSWVIHGPSLCLRRRDRLVGALEGLQKGGSGSVRDGSRIGLGLSKRYFFLLLFYCTKCF